LQYLVSEFLNADAVSEPRQGSVDKVKESEEGYQVGGDVGDQRYGVRSTYRCCLDEIDLRSAVLQTSNITSFITHIAQRSYT